jgi:hypothetical protein
MKRRVRNQAGEAYLAVSARVTESGDGVLGRNWTFAAAMSACLVLSGPLRAQEFVAPEFWDNPDDVSRSTSKPEEASADEALFLDRLMMAESGGRLDAKNPRSTALGPFQFIQSTFHDVMNRHFPDIADGKSFAELQALRVNLEISRKAALQYTRENAAFLNERGVKPEPEFLRLAFLLGPSGALAVISAKPDAAVADLLTASAIEANPFMARMTAEQLIARAKREADGLKPLKVLAGVKAASPQPRIKVRCDLDRPSCRRWLALAKRREARKVAKK